ASISVMSKASCGSADKALRDYVFTYQADVDTQRPQLRSVTVKGREDTPERTAELPIATYSYGAIADSSRTITYRDVPLPGPPKSGDIYTYGISATRAQDSTEGA